MKAVIQLFLSFIFINYSIAQTKSYRGFSFLEKPVLHTIEKQFETESAIYVRDGRMIELIGSKEGIDTYIKELLQQVQVDLFDKALQYRETHITEVNSFEEFKEVLEGKGGFISAHWDGTAATEEEIKNTTKATIRCIPLDRVEEAGSCVLTGNPSVGRVLFAKAY